MKECRCDGRFDGCTHGLPCSGGPLYPGDGGYCPDCAEQYFLAASRRFVAGLQAQGVQIDSVTRREPQ